MRKVQLRCLAFLLSFVSLTAVAGCEMAQQPYRTYYQDASCNLYYMDYAGNKVYEERARDGQFSHVGLASRRDVDGRIYYQDSYGNRLYKVSECHS